MVCPIAEVSVRSHTPEISVRLACGENGGMKSGGNKGGARFPQFCEVVRTVAQLASVGVN